MAETPRADLLSLPPDALRRTLTQHFRGRGQPAYRAGQVERWIVERLAPSLEVMTDLPRVEREALAERYELAEAEVHTVARSEDGTVKHVWRLSDGELIESVLIPTNHRLTLCISSQAGCAMGCTFCATGRLGFTRNLQAWEIVQTMMTVRAELDASKGERITGAVFMGQGEPLANYDEVVRAAYILSHPCGGRIEGKAISISTVGLVPQILRYASEGHKFRLVISLTSAIASKRKTLLPVAGTYTLDDVAAAIRTLHKSTNDRVTIAWVLLGGVNTGDDEVHALKALLPDVPIRVNLIDVNDARHGDDVFRRATPDELARFLDALQLLGQPVVRRYSGGQNRHAACGMLAAVEAARLDSPTA